MLNSSVNVQLIYFWVLWLLSNSTFLFNKGGKYREALGKWETALTLIPKNAVLHEQKAQVLLEIGDAWNALKAATRMPHPFFLLLVMY